NKGVEKVAKGDLSYRIELKRTDEIGDLAKAFNKMSSDLNQYIENLKKRLLQRNEYKVSLN
ncbi:MAG: HAMP domain-containing protein, partial [Chloroflexia bacterium]|nr:HAMP domain-containing protein [Chloroflexia bacterium]